MAHDVAHDEQGAAVVQAYRLEPVPAHEGAAAGREVAGGEIKVGVGAGRLGQQSPLEVQRRAPGRGVAVGVFEVYGRQACRVVHGGHLLVGEGGAGTDGQYHPVQTAVCEERHRYGCQGYARRRSGRGGDRLAFIHRPDQHVALRSAGLQQAAPPGRRDARE